MIGLLVLLLITGLSMTVLWWATVRRRDRRVVHQLRRADADVQGAYRRARRAMNDAAGQSWRNILDDGYD